MEKIVFTDLDGSLLGDDYSYEKAKSALNLIKEKNIPLIICTSKTKKEIEFYRERLENKCPFISENGGAIFIPKDYFSFEFEYDNKDENYFIIKLGKDYDEILKIFNLIKQNYKVKGFSDMSDEEIAKDTRLPLEQAKLAKERHFDEPFKIISGNKEEIIRIIEENGLRYEEGGRYSHIMGLNDKGAAIKILSDLLKKKYDEIYSIGVGDSENDFAMFDSVDKAYLVKKQDETYASDKYDKVEGIASEGWNQAIVKELS